ncbi:hypothetical protein SAMN05660909_03408 [Chitinophaga terrae (ex Kim and Jung 2007)]|uniref:Nucleotidyltransferase domain-containing protein n=1 Tax=Chitinophaga terrae (ex Kim and Jung 2007) TaxID=408074 RepID=A0A1H4DYL8_9BACT|nr:hypothetical protein [Chitinophaga terrae (ex Kim and Jung 2007)]MDQ0104936.1 hypothetical protein [Chitinophaga terrae (ex Kim and Jung 2007)]GEP91269.1 hypothetical protein CTE07_29140 [Chitinophaga terrae (ex Kim and Jung 2007)]SEA77851.1 hypothetical protein SAMN05660909_03408 [Chitinophaga terrae (ex Kim and Jung 2007)]
MKQLSLEHLKEVLDVLEEVFAELNIDFYMIGAIAKEYWYTRGNKRMRQTKDVDFAIFVASYEEYKAVRNRLKDHHFVDTRENAFVMISPPGYSRKPLMKNGATQKSGWRKTIIIQMSVLQESQEKSRLLTKSIQHVAFLTI